MEVKEGISRVQFYLHGRPTRRTGRHGERLKEYPIYKFLHVLLLKDETKAVSPVPTPF